MPASGTQKSGTQTGGPAIANVKRNKLSPLQVKHAQPGTHMDGGGLMLRVHPSGGKNWVLRLTVDGRRRQLGVGGYPDVSLKAARDQAEDMRQLVQDGVDPAVHIKAQRIKKASIPTFGQAAETVIELRAPTWANDKHATRWRASMRLHVPPALRKKRVDSVTTADVLDVLMPLWNDKREMATRVRQRMTTIFDFAIAAGWRSDNPSNVALNAALPRRPRQRRHYPALPYPEVATALDAIRTTGGHETVKSALTFAVMTAARTGEVLRATWDEIDLDGKVWTVPADRMKMRRDHRVPLSTGALEVLEQAQERTKGKGLVFPSNRKAGRSLSDMVLLMLLRRARYEHITTHGFRASFRTWALEQTDAPWAVAEAALAHNLGDGTVLAYVRSDLFERRRELMQQWSDYIANTSARMLTRNGTSC